MMPTSDFLTLSPRAGLQVELLPPSRVLHSFACKKEKKKVDSTFLGGRVCEYDETEILRVAPPLPLHSYREPPTEFCLLLPRRPRKFIPNSPFLGNCPLFFALLLLQRALVLLTTFVPKGEREGRGEETDARSLRAEKTN